MQRVSPLNSCLAMSVFQPFVDIPATPWQSLLNPDVCDTPLGVKPEESLPSTLGVMDSSSSPILARVSRIASSNWLPLGADWWCLGSPPIKRRISDPCSALVPWASGPLVLSQTKDWSRGLCPGLRLQAFPVPPWKRMAGAELSFGIHPEDS